MIQQGEIIYGGVGTTRYRLDYDDPAHVPFRDIWRRPGRFKFFVPTEADLSLADGLILDSGRSTLSEDKKRIHFAVSTFNSGKATTGVDLPDENPLYVSLSLAAELGLSAGDHVRVTGVDTQASLVLSVIPTSRVRGRTPSHCRFRRAAALRIREAIPRRCAPPPSHVHRIRHMHRAR